MTKHVVPTDFGDPDSSARAEPVRAVVSVLMCTLIITGHLAAKIEFQGGEPLLNFDLINYIVGRAEAVNCVAKRELQFVIATNLAVATDEMLEFCAEHSIQISASLDGPEDLHNKNRPRPGRDSYQRAVDGIARARRVVGRGAVSALMTTTGKSLDRVCEHTVHGDFVGRKAESAFCQRSMATCRHLIELMRSDTEVKRIFYRWANW